MLEREVSTILSVGAAVQDVFLSGDVFKPQNEDGQLVEEFKLGEKYELGGVVFATGGGATNAAVTFARQGLHAKFLGKLGEDVSARMVLDDLHQNGVDTSLVKTDAGVKTGYSTLLLAPTGERTILTFRGSSDDFKPDDFLLGSTEADWLYISSLAGAMDALESLIGWAQSRNIRIAINPGKGELAQADQLRELLKSCQVLIVNKDEIGQLVAGQDDQQLVRHASDMTPIVVMTDGPNGATATNREIIVAAGMYEDVPVIDRTGAGDAFGSGLVAALARGQSLAEAVKFASANSTSVVGQIGAKAGILDKDVVLHDMPLEVNDF
ncbi:MAG TPA: carbohydrate kinase family protein [Candidatus Saccharimonadales bacterium]